MELLNYILLCESVTFDQEKRPSFINVFDRIDVSELPASIPEAYIAFSFWVKGKEGELLPVMKIKMTNPKGRTILQIEGTPTPGKDILPMDGYTKVASSLDIGKIVFKEYGDYPIELSFTDGVKFNTIFQVRKIKGGK